MGEWEAAVCLGRGGDEGRFVGVARWSVCWGGRGMNSFLGAFVIKGCLRCVVIFSLQQRARFKGKEKSTGESLLLAAPKQIRVE